MDTTEILEEARATRSVWEIRILGELSIVAEGGREIVPRFPSRKAEALLSFLACHPAVRHRRDALIEQFWPDVDIDDARNSFRVTLSRLRRCLEQAGVSSHCLFASDRDYLYVNRTQCVTDVQRFEAALRSARQTRGDTTAESEAIAKALSFYRGPLLTGCDEGWAFAERMRLEDSFVTASHRLLDILEQGQNWEAATLYARRALAVDPLREETHRRLAGFYLCAGRPADARRQWSELVEIWRTEMGESPSPKALDWAIQYGLTDGWETGAKSKRLLSPIPLQPPPTLPTHIDSSTLAPKLEPVPEPFSVPSFLTRFCGREEELKLLQRAITHDLSRLITVTGLGGVGKTRFVAETIRHLWRATNAPLGGVWWVSLANMDSAGQLPETLAAILRTKLPENTPCRDTLRQAFARHTASHPGRQVLVLDNADRLIPTDTQRDGLYPIIVSLLEDCPELYCLVTSRQRLGIPGEMVLSLAPLPTPPPETSDPERFAAGALFADCARRLNPGFTVHAENAAAIGETVRRVDGLPLAVELVAAYLSVLTPDQIAERLRRYGIGSLTAASPDEESETGPDTTTSGHSYSLLAAIDWSFRRLPSEARRLLLCLSVLHGEWDRDAATALWSASGLTAGVEHTEKDSSHSCQSTTDTIALLALLRERSLIQTRRYTAPDGKADRQESNPQGVRFCLLETVREYVGGLFHTLLTQEEQDTIRLRYACHFLSVARAASRLPPEQGGALLRPDYENLRNALEWCLHRAQGSDTGGDVLKTAISFAIELGRVWKFGYAPLTEGRAFQQRILACLGDAPEPTPDIVRFILDTAYFASLRGDGKEATRLYAFGAPLARRLGNPDILCSFLMHAGIHACECGETDRAGELYEEALQRFDPNAGRPWQRTMILLNLGTLRSRLGDFAGAHQAYTGALESSQECGSVRMTAASHCEMGFVLTLMGELAAARIHLDEGLRLFDDLGVAGDIAEMQRLEAEWYLASGDTATALARYKAGLRGVAECGGPFAVAFAIEGLVRVAGRTGDWQRAARLLGIVDELRRKRGQPQTSFEKSEFDALRVQGRKALSPTVFEAMESIGRTMPFPQALHWILE
jgi:DNA-binding SARP family transcriptional activator/predicted ATPase